MSAKRTRRGAVTVLSTTGQTDYVFQPQRAAEVSLILSAVASFVGIVFLIRAGVCWEALQGGPLVLLVVTAVCWTAMAVTALVTLYARSLSPHETWMWEQALRVILYYGAAWWITFALTLSLCVQLFYPALACDTDSDLACLPLHREISIEVFCSIFAALLLALAMTIFVSIDLHTHRWLTIRLPASAATDPLLPRWAPTNNSDSEGGGRYPPIAQRQPFMADTRIYQGWASAPAPSAPATGPTGLTLDDQREYPFSTEGVQSQQNDVGRMFSTSKGTSRRETDEDEDGSQTSTSRDEKRKRVEKKTKTKRKKRVTKTRTTDEEVDAFDVPRKKQGKRHRRRRSHSPRRYPSSDTSDPDTALTGRNSSNKRRAVGQASMSANLAALNGFASGASVDTSASASVPS